MRESLKEFKVKRGNDIVDALEVGVCSGQNAKRIFDALRVNKLYLIDNYRIGYNVEVVNWFKEAKKRFKENSKVTFIINNSVNVLELFRNESLDYVYLDGSHSPDVVYKEMVLYWGKVKKGGMMAGHDYDYGLPTRVKQAITSFTMSYDLKYEHRKNENERVEDWWIWK